MIESFLSLCSIVSCLMNTQGRDVLLLSFFFQREENNVSVSLICNFRVFPERSGIPHNESLRVVAAPSTESRKFINH